MKPKKNVKELNHESSKGHTHEENFNEEQHIRHPEGKHHLNKDENKGALDRIGRYGKRVFPYPSRNIK